MKELGAASCSINGQRHPVLGRIQLCCEPVEAACAAGLSLLMQDSCSQESMPHNYKE